MTIRHSGVETYRIISQFFLQKINQFTGFFGADMSSRMTFDNSIFDANQITAHGYFVILNFHAHTGSLQYASAFIHAVQIIA